MSGRQRWVFVWVALLVSPAKPFAATSFVAPFGSDTSAGSVEEPFQTVQRGVAALRPGDTLVILPGRYHEVVVVSQSGTPEAPIVIRAEAGAEFISPDPTASLSAFDLRGVSHVLLDGIVASGGYHETLFLRPGSHDVTIRECSISGNRAGLWVAGSQRVWIEDCVFRNNVHHGVRIFAGSREIVVRRTRAEHNTDGLGCNGDSDGFTTAADTEVLFEDCVSQYNGEDGFDLQGAAIVRRSVSLDNECVGLKFSGGGRGENLLIVGNRVGLATSASHPAVVEFVLEHSTIVDNTQQQVLLNAPQPQSGVARYAVAIHNSILSGQGKALEAQSGVALSESFNLFFRPESTEAVVVFRGSNGQKQFSGQDINAGVYRASTGNGRGTYAMDPQFDLVAGDYRLSPESPAVDSADPESTQSTDLRRRSRPVGSRPDRGALESEYSSRNHAPWPDPGPSRRVLAGRWFRVSAYGSADVDGDPLSYKWTFDPPSRTVPGFAAQHLYALPGSYTAFLSASDGTLDATRPVYIAVDYPPSRHARHDSAVVPFAAPVTVKFPVGTDSLPKLLRVRVRNEDDGGEMEPLGHLIRLLARDGTCPAGTVAGEPDFEARLPGPQNTALVGPKRTRLARVPLLLTRTIGTTCDIELTAESIFPDNVDPNPSNDVTVVQIRVRD